MCLFGLRFHGGLAILASLVILLTATTTHAAMDPGRMMHPQGRHRKIDVLTGKYGVEAGVQGLRDDQGFQLKRDIQGFIVGIIIVSVLLGVTWCVGIISCIKLMTNRSTLRRLKDAREETLTMQETMGAPLMSHAPPIPPTSTLNSSMPVPPPHPLRQMHHQPQPLRSPVHAHGHGHGHGHARSPRHAH